MLTKAVNRMNTDTNVDDDPKDPVHVDQNGGGLTDAQTT